MAPGSRVPLLDVDPNIQIHSQTKSKRKRKAQRIVEDTDSENDTPVEPTQEALSDTDDDEPIVAKIKRQRLANTSIHVVHQNEDFQDEVYEQVDLMEGVSPEENLNPIDEREEASIPDKQVKNWVTRLLKSRQDPPKDISPFLKPGVTLPIIPGNQQRFKTTITSMVDRTMDYANSVDLTHMRGKGFKERAMNVGFASLFQRLEVSSVLKPFFKAISPEVMSLLGRSDLAPHDLLDLPEIDYNFRLWGVYVNVVTDRDGNVVRVYLGSSVAYRTYVGIIGRIRWHLKRSEQPYDTIPKHEQSAHYRLITQEGMTCNFRFIALFEIKASNVAPTVIAEAFLMCFLSTIKGSFSEQKNFVEMLQSDLPVSTFSNLGLNRGFPFATGYQGMPSDSQLHKIWLDENSLEDKCFNCGRLAPSDDKHWGGCFTGRRCVACKCWRNDHGYEKPPGTYGSQGDHELWLLEGNEDVCQNSACQEPRRPIPGVFYLFGPESRCRPCYEHRKKNGGTDKSDPYAGRSAANHEAWLEEGNDDVYGKCHVSRPEKSHLVGWTGWLDASRCPLCSDGHLTESDDEEWVNEYGNTCALCGVSSEFTGVIFGRAHKRRCRSCNNFRRLNGRDRDPDELAYGDKSRHEEWVAQGNPNVCGGCGKSRPVTGASGFNGWRENQRCNKCYFSENYRIVKGKKIRRTPMWAKGKQHGAISRTKNHERRRR